MDKSLSTNNNSDQFWMDELKRCEKEPSYFARQYFKIKQPDGTSESVTISDYEAAVMDAAHQMQLNPYIRYRGRGHSGIIVNPLIEKRVKELLDERSKPKP